jgi:nitrogen fixation/metabolism regulation signal transduction histidine kinase
MTPTQSFLAYWWYHVPNLAMAALIYTLIGRYLLELLFARHGDAVILKVFRSITDWFVRLVRAITPAIVPNGLVVVFAIVWLTAARMLWFLTAVAAGMRVGVGA